MKTISARMFLLTGALICLSGCGNILGTGGKSTLYRISSTPVPEREIARQWIPVYITRPTLPPGADGDRILTIENREVTYLAKARWMRPAPEMIRSEEHTSELKSLMSKTYAVFYSKKKTN